MATGCGGGSGGGDGDDFWNGSDADADADTDSDSDSDSATENPAVGHNVYLGEVIEQEWNPGLAGAMRANAGAGMIGPDLVPELNERALGPPLGTGPWSTSGEATAVGVGGSAAWRFEQGYCIYDGPGDDFATFENSFAWGLEVDGLCCELAHVEVSEDLESWYRNDAEQYLENPAPTESNDGYSYFEVSGMHGNNPTWANHTQQMQAQEIVDGEWVDIPDVFVPPDFAPTDEHLGGDRFDLADFGSKEDGTPWPADGRMRYLRIVDDETVLDGQDYDKDWCLGAQMHAAMGINVKVDSDGLKVKDSFR